MLFNNISLQPFLRQFGSSLICWVSESLTRLRGRHMVVETSTTQSWRSKYQPCWKARSRYLHKSDINNAEMSCGADWFHQEMIAGKALGNCDILKPASEYFAVAHRMFVVAGMRGDDDLAWHLLPRQQGEGNGGKNSTSWGYWWGYLQESVRQILQESIVCFNNDIS